MAYTEKDHEAYKAACKAGYLEWKNDVIHILRSLGWKTTQIFYGFKNAPFNSKEKFYEGLTAAQCAELIYNSAK